MNLAKKCDEYKKQLEELTNELNQLRKILYSELESSDFIKPKTYNTIYSMDPSILSIFNKSRPIYLITLSHDPQFLDIPNTTQCINYYLNSIDNVIIAIDDETINIVGSFELNQKGRVHAHLLFQNYSGPAQFIELIKPCLTQRKYLNVAVDCRPVNNNAEFNGASGLNGSFNYLIKSPLLSFFTPGTKLNQPVLCRDDVDLEYYI